MKSPILFVQPILIDGNVKRFRVWCIYCNDWHYHGPMEGHRECHCSSIDSPYHGTGYVLKCRTAIDIIIAGDG